MTMVGRADSAGRLPPPPRPLPHRRTRDPRRVRHCRRVDGVRSALHSQHSPGRTQLHLASRLLRCSSPPPPRSPPRCAAAAIAPCSPAPPCGGCGPRSASTSWVSACSSLGRASQLRPRRLPRRILVNCGLERHRLLVAALATPRNRGRIHRRLGRLGGRGTEAEEAAAVAALVGGSAPDAALERAAKLLRCLPASRLHAADLAASGLAPSTRADCWHARTEPAAMGEVTAFLSHSWSDEEEAPGAKHALVSRWARRRQETTGKEPTLWLVSARPHLHRTLPLALTTHTCIRTLACATGQGVHRPEQHPAVARLLARLPRGLPDAARRGRAHVLLTAVVRHGALHVRSE